MHPGLYMKAIHKVVEEHFGKIYPVGALFLDLLGIRRWIYDKKVVCSEMVAEFLYHATGLPDFENHFGWTPAELAVVCERWKDFEVVWKGEFHVAHTSGGDS